MHDEHACLLIYAHAVTAGHTHRQWADVKCEYQLFVPTQNRHNSSHVCKPWLVSGAWTEALYCSCRELTLNTCVNGIISCEHHNFCWCCLGWALVHWVTAQGMWQLIEAELVVTSTCSPLNLVEWFPDWSGCESVNNMTCIHCNIIRTCTCMNSFWLSSY